MVLMIKNNELRTYFQPVNSDLKVAAFAYDLSSWGYNGGRVGLYMYAHQAQFLDFRIGSLVGNNAVTEFCEYGGSCSPRTGLCE